jgi:hypothetical protein
LSCLEGRHVGVGAVDERVVPVEQLRDGLQGDGRGGREIERRRIKDALITLHAEVWKDRETVCMASHVLTFAM